MQPLHPDLPENQVQQLVFACKFFLAPSIWLNNLISLQTLNRNVGSSRIWFLQVFLQTKVVFLSHDQIVRDLIVLCYS